MRRPFAASVEPACPLPFSTENLEVCLDDEAWRELVGGEGA